MTSKGFTIKIDGKIHNPRTPILDPRYALELVSDLQSTLPTAKIEIWDEEKCVYPPTGTGDPF